MGHRASVLYKSKDNQGNCRYTHVYSHWGAEHEEDIKGISKDNVRGYEYVHSLDELSFDDITDEFKADDQDIENEDFAEPFESIPEWKDEVESDVSYEAGYIVDTTKDEWKVDRVYDWHSGWSLDKSTI